MRGVGTTHRYAELHCHTNYSFLDGASHPEELVRTAAELELEAVIGEILAETGGKSGQGR